MMSGVKPGKLREFDTLESSSRDMKSLQAFIDMALRVKHIIDVNLETLDAMTQVMSELQDRKSNINPTQIGSLLRSLNKIRQQHRLSTKNYSSMIDRARSLSEQGKLSETRITAHLLTALCQLRNTFSIRNSAATTELTVRSGYEAHVVKVLTVLLIFVPASFVSVSSPCIICGSGRQCTDFDRISFSSTTLKKYRLPASSPGQKMTYRSMLFWQFL